MKAAEQTPEVKQRLFFLTGQFTKKYVHRYYKQYRGEIEDLIMDYYLDFLTPKSRIEGQEETLLDKYNSEITCLEYLVKVSIIRKLIDSSRQDCRGQINIDHFQDEYGDVITKAFGLITDEDDEVGHIEDVRTFTKAEVEVIKSKFQSLTESAQKKIRDQFEEVKDVIAPAYRDAISAAIGYKTKVVKEVEALLLSMQNSCLQAPEMTLKCLCQQITPKTVCLFDGAEVIDFNRETGACRKKGYNMRLTSETLEFLRTFGVYHSGYSRFEIPKLKASRA